ncbi:MAG: hypothetical protein DCC68_25715 [Planctomycetota bacterium]|nr:MAG: hypothetical protein DCC68_25715 [Planctomycetota bacterium]
MQVRMLGKRWRLRFVLNLGANRGDCDAPDRRAKEIRVAAGLRGEERLEVLIHELVHAAGWHIDESFVERFAADAARVLWRLGYRDARRSAKERR